MKKIILILFVFFGLTSCSPTMHVHSVGMRHHNLQYNKYRPGKYRRPVRKVWVSPTPPVWWLLRNR